MDSYKTVKLIGQGGFGKAYLVLQKTSNKEYVMKEIDIRGMPPEEKEDSKKEVAVLAQLKHPNIVTYIESFEGAGTLYIVMNYYAGGDMHAKIKSQQGHMFMEKQVLNWFVQICLAIKHIHDQKILHRDIKPQNIFLSTSGRVKIGDFGIAKVLVNTWQRARTIIGTPNYLAPEVVVGTPYGNKSDIWSLGCVLYELTTLKRAFEVGDCEDVKRKISRIPSQFSDDLIGLVAQLFKIAPRDRPSINSILEKNFITERVGRLQPAEQIGMHVAKLAKALPPAPRLSSAGHTPGPGLRYNPAGACAVPLDHKSQNRSPGDQKQKASGGGANRPNPIQQIVMHGAQLAKALPPAPRPSSAGHTPGPGLRYNPAGACAVPPGLERSPGDQKKKASGGGANRLIPYQVVNNDREFQVSIDVHPFRSHEINHKIKGNHLIVSAHHEEDLFSMEFTWQYVLPNDVDPAGLTSTLNTDRVLTLKLSKRKFAWI